MDDKLRITLLNRLNEVSDKLNIQILEVQSIAAALRMNDAPEEAAQVAPAEAEKTNPEVTEMQQSIARLEQLVLNMQSEKPAEPAPTAEAIKPAPVETKPAVEAKPAVKPKAAPQAVPVAAEPKKEAPKPAREPITLGEPISVNVSYGDQPNKAAAAAPKKVEPAKAPAAEKPAEPAKTAAPKKAELKIKAAAPKAEPEPLLLTDPIKK